MIKNFADKETERTFNREFSRRLSPQIPRRPLIKLTMLDAAHTLQDLRVPPSNHLEKLGGQRGEQYSIRINDRWRICFIWKDGDAFDVEIVDYH